MVRPQQHIASESRAFTRGYDSTGNRPVFRTPEGDRKVVLDPQDNGLSAFWRQLKELPKDGSCVVHVALIKVGWKQYFAGILGPNMSASGLCEGDYHVCLAHLLMEYGAKYKSQVIHWNIGKAGQRCLLKIQHILPVTHADMPGWTYFAKDCDGMKEAFALAKREFVKFAEENKFKPDMEPQRPAVVPVPFAAVQAETAKPQSRQNKRVREPIMRDRELGDGSNVREYGFVRKNGQKPTVLTDVRRAKGDRFKVTKYFKGREVWVYPNWETTCGVALRLAAAGMREGRM